MGLTTHRVRTALGRWVRALKHSFSRPFSLSLFGLSRLRCTALRFKCSLFSSRAQHYQLIESSELY